MTSTLRKPLTTASALDRLLEDPGLVSRVRSMPPRDFSAMIRSVGVEDAGELVELATLDQLVTAFDEDLFSNDRPGEREIFDPARFALWLEVMVEASPAAAAKQFLAMSDEFAVGAITGIAMVLDNERLMHRMALDDAGARLADKAIDNALLEEIDGYLIVSRLHEGWDALMELILHLDREERGSLERLLDRCASVCDTYIDDLDELVTALSEAETLAEDVEAQRDERRSAAGHVEPRAARAFLELAARPPESSGALERDPLTAAYFREMAQSGPGAPVPSKPPSKIPALPASEDAETNPAGMVEILLEAMRALSRKDGAIFSARMTELAYLSNAIAAGAGADRRRFGPLEAAEAALSTVTLGAALEAGFDGGDPDPAAILAAISRHPADVLFRLASGALTRSGYRGKGGRFIESREELGAAIGACSRSR